MENLWSGRRGSTTKAIAANLSVVRSSSLLIYFPISSRNSFEDIKKVRIIAKIIDI